MARRSEDRYTNLASIEVTETAANTLTFAELLTGISLGQGTGILIDQLDYYPTSPSLDDLVLPADTITMAICTSNAITTLNINQRSVIHAMSLHAGPAIGTNAGGGMFTREPFIHQFFPPIILAAPRLFLAAQGASLAAAITLRLRMYFRYIELTDKEYLELAETFILVG